MPLTKNRDRRVGWSYEQDRALDSLGQSNEGQKLRDRLVLCWKHIGTMLNGWIALTPRSEPCFEKNAAGARAYCIRASSSSNPSHTEAT
jgi:hypothetical protein